MISCRSSTFIVIDIRSILISVVISIFLRFNELVSEDTVLSFSLALGVIFIILSLALAFSLEYLSIIVTH